MVTGQHPARGRRPCQGESTVYADSDDEYEDAAGSSIAYSSVVLWQRGRNTVLGLKYLIQIIQIKQKWLHHKHTNSQLTRSH